MLPNTTPFVAFDPLPADRLNDLLENDEALSDGSGIEDDAITYVKLLSTIFSGQVTTDTNPGTAGGSRNYINLGGIKLCWGTAASFGISASLQTTRTVTFPTSFFGSTPMVVLGGIPSGNVGVQDHIGALSSSTLTLAVDSTTGSNNTATMVIHWLAIGFA